MIQGVVEFGSEVYDTRAGVTGVGEHGMAQRTGTGTGMVPRALMQRLPLLPLEEGGRLNDLPLRENFSERVFRSPERSEGDY